MMYDESLLVTYLKEQTNYTINLTDDTVGVQTSLSNNEVKVYIGHIGLTVKDVQLVWANGFDELSSSYDLMLRTQVQLLCKRTDQVEAWNNLFTALSSFTPYLGNGSYGCMALIESALQAQAGGKVFWASHYGLVIPRTS